MFQKDLNTRVNEVISAWAKMRPHKSFFGSMWAEQSSRCSRKECMTCVFAKAARPRCREKSDSAEYGHTGSWAFLRARLRYSFVAAWSAWMTPLLLARCLQPQALLAAFVDWRCALARSP
jgi:hypothetical protein